MSFYCSRCKNTGQINERYAKLPPLLPPDINESIPVVEYKIKQRKRECPDCLGFGAVAGVL